jgi:hypothetical protein
VLRRGCDRKMPEVMANSLESVGVTFVLAGPCAFLGRK